MNQYCYYYCDAVTILIACYSSDVKMFACRCGRGVGVDLTRACHLIGEEGGDGDSIGHFDLLVARAPRAAAAQCRLRSKFVLNELKVNLPLVCFSFAFKVANLRLLLILVIGSCYEEGILLTSS